jgi:hypothetical protein
MLFLTETGIKILIIDSLTFLNLRCFAINVNFFLSQRHVLTAAHCTAILNQMNYTQSDFRIKLAEHDLSNNKDCAFYITGLTIRNFFNIPTSILEYYER